MLSKHVIDVLNFTNKRYTKNNHNLIQLCQQIDSGRFFFFSFLVDLTILSGKEM